MLGRVDGSGTTEGAGARRPRPELRFALSDAHEWRGPARRHGLPPRRRSRTKRR